MHGSIGSVGSGPCLAGSQSLTGLVYEEQGLTIVEIAQTFVKQEETFHDTLQKSAQEASNFEVE